MKKSTALLLLLMISLFTLPCFGQLKIGLNGGVVLSSLVRDNSLSARAGKVGYLVGLTGKYNLGELGWYVQSGLNFTLEGDHDQPLNFLKVPLTLGLDMSDDVSLFVDYNLAWITGNKNQVQDFYHGYANILGMGFSINSIQNISLTTRLNYGLSNLVSIPMEAKNFKIRPFTLDLFMTWYFLR